MRKQKENNNGTKHPIGADTVHWLQKQKLTHTSPETYSNYVMWIKHVCKFKSPPKNK